MNRLAVLIPVYGNQVGLNRSLESLREAAGTFDVVIVDDGTPDPIRADGALREGVPVSLHRLPRNRGIGIALNHGLREIVTRGFDFVARLDAGDVVTAERLDRQAEFLDTHPNCGIVGSFVDFVDANGKPMFRYKAPTTHPEIVRRLHIENCLMHPAVMMRVRMVADAGLYQESSLGEDYELFLRMARRCEIAVLPEVLTCCEYSLTGISVSNRRRAQLERLRLQIGYFDPLATVSYYGIARSVLALCAPHTAVLRAKSILFR